MARKEVLEQENDLIRIIIYFGKYNSYLYSLCGGLFCVTIIIARLLDIAAHKTMRRVVLIALLSWPLYLLLVYLYLLKSKTIILLF